VVHDLALIRSSHPRLKWPVHPSIAVYLRLVCILAVTTAAAAKSWVIRLDGAGPVKVGMTLAQLNATLKEDFSIPTDEDEQACFYAETARHPGIAFMVEHGRVTRVDVRERGLATVAGVRVGDPEALVMKVYGQRLKVEQHAYDPGEHYLTLYSANGRYGLRFETGDGKIISFYAGEQHAIAYIEGCQ
jgi:hypothetical protein